MYVATDKKQTKLAVECLPWGYFSIFYSIIRNFWKSRRSECGNTLRIADFDSKYFAPRLKIDFHINATQSKFSLVDLMVRFIWSKFTQAKIRTNEIFFITHRSSIDGANVIQFHKRKFHTLKPINWKYAACEIFSTRMLFTRFDRAEKTNSPNSCFTSHLRWLSGLHRNRLLPPKAFCANTKENRTLEFPKPKKATTRVLLGELKTEILKSQIYIRSLHVNLFVYVNYLQISNVWILPLPPQREENKLWKSRIAEPFSYVRWKVFTLIIIGLLTARER